jgi:dipeptidyl aminopeptidase/acylaminoacyl peptidase
MVPILEGRSMHQALLRAGVKTEFVTIDGGNHGFIGWEADTALTRTVEWFRENLIQPQEGQSR